MKALNAIHFTKTKLILLQYFHGMDCSKSPPLAIWFAPHLLSLDVWRPWKLHWDVSEVARSWFWAWLPRALCFHLPGVKTTVPLSQCKWQTYYPVCYILIALSHWFQSNSLYSIIVTIDNYIQNLLLSFISL